AALPVLAAQVALRLAVVGLRAEAATTRMRAALEPRVAGRARHRALKDAAGNGGAARVALAVLGAAVGVGAACAPHAGALGRRASAAGADAGAAVDAGAAGKARRVAEHPGVNAGAAGAAVGNTALARAALARRGADDAAV